MIVWLPTDPDNSLPHRCPSLILVPRPSFTLKHVPAMHSKFGSESPDGHSIMFSFCELSGIRSDDLDVP
ncbi:hypothetical protein BDR07DRAFT_1413418 [Suillus spraguei]|nr:hypothetical protein BDR07DRAFT_1438208 [Suillus spraguei]KAG2360035.1 hypothetical protein BDR07DRAFT_1413418 [Suillus spraguei]